MKTENGKRTRLKIGDSIIFHEEGTISFCRLGEILYLSSGDYRVYLSEVITKDKDLALGLARLIAQSHGLRISKEESRQGCLIFDFMED